MWMSMRARAKGVWLLSGGNDSHGKEARKPVKEKIKPILKSMTTYKALFILWLAIGIMTIITDCRN